MHVNGANHTPRISQFQIAFAVSSGAHTVHPSPSATYPRYLTKRVTPCDEESGNEDARVRGSPRRTARVAAREKLRTDVMDITVDARQRFKAFTRDESGATVGGWCNGVARTPNNGRAEAANNTTGERTILCFTKKDVVITENNTNPRT